MEVLNMVYADIEMVNGSFYTEANIIKSEDDYLEVIPYRCAEATIIKKDTIKKIYYYKF